MVMNRPSNFCQWLRFNKEGFGEEFEDKFEVAFEATTARGLCVRQGVVAGRRQRIGRRYIAERDQALDTHL